MKSRRHPLLWRAQSKDHPERVEDIWITGFVSRTRVCARRDLDGSLESTHQ